MASLVYANPSSGPSAGGIGWIDFGFGFSLAPGASATGITASLLDGSTVTFNITNTTVVAPGTPFFAFSTDVSNAFGGIGYTDIIGAVVLLSQNPGGEYGSRITIDNISVTDPNGNPVTNYTFVVADSQNTNSPLEDQEWKTTGGGVWEQLIFLGDPTSPTVTGLGTDTVNLVGVSGGTGGAPVVTTTSPTMIETYLHGINGNQGVTFGIAINKVQIDKVITSRYSAVDQFDLTILGTPSNTVTTTGSSTGLQSESAYVYGLVNNTYSINESMAAGSFGSLANYDTTVVWSNLAVGGTAGPDPGALGDNVTLALGDVLTATVTNTVKVTPPGRGIEFI